MSMGTVLFDKILILVIVLLIGGIICGGYFLYKNNEESNKKIAELENKIATVNNEDKSNSSNEVINDKKIIKRIMKLIIKK